MRTLVVWYSKTSRTKTVGLSLAKMLNADTDEILDTKKRNGLWNWLIAGKDAYKKTVTNIVFKKDPEKYDLIIIGTPVWANTMTPAIRTYIEQNKTKLKKIAIFCTQGSPHCSKALDRMEELFGPVEAKEDFQTITIDNGTYREKLEQFAKRFSKS